MHFAQGQIISLEYTTTRILQYLRKLFKNVNAVVLTYFGDL